MIEFIRIWDGEAVRNLTAAEQTVLEVEVSKETYSRVKELYNAARAVRHVKVDKMAPERHRVEALRLQLLADEADRKDLGTRRIRFSARVVRPLAEVEYQLLITPVSMETDLQRLEKLIGFVEASRSAYFGTKGQQVSGTGSTASKATAAGHVIITRTDRRALQSATVETVTSPDANGWGRKHVVDPEAAESAPKRGGAPVVGQGYAQAMQPAGPSVRGGMTTQGSRGARTRKNAKK